MKRIFRPAANGVNTIFHRAGGEGLLYKTLESGYITYGLAEASVGANGFDGDGRG